MATCNSREIEIFKFKFFLFRITYLIAKSLFILDLKGILRHSLITFLVK
jgi:hypothetical protein